MQRHKQVIKKPADYAAQPVNGSLPGQVFNLFQIGKFGANLTKLYIPFPHKFFVLLLTNKYNMNSSILLWALGAPEIIIILVVVLLLFGGKKIPELMRGLGKGIREFKDASKGVDSDIPEKKN